MCAQNGLRGLAMMYLLDYNLTPMECSHVLLETVALGAHEDQTLVGFGRKPEVGDPAWCQQQQLLADVQNSGDTAGRIQRVVEGAGFAQCERPVVQGPGLHGKEKRKSFVERANLVVPPTADPHGGWCGGGRRLEAVAYPINWCPHEATQSRNAS